MGLEASWSETALKPGHLCSRSGAVTQAAVRLAVNGRLTPHLPTCLWPVPSRGWVSHLPRSLKDG